MLENSRGNGLFLLFKSSTKSEAYFRAVRWQGRRHCPRCKYLGKIYPLQGKKLRFLPNRKSIV